MNGACNGTIVFGPAPRVPGEGQKGNILLHYNYKVNSKDFKTKLIVFSHK